MASRTGWQKLPKCRAIRLLIADRGHGVDRSAVSGAAHFDKLLLFGAVAADSEGSSTSAGRTAESAEVGACPGGQAAERGQFT